MWNSEFLAFFPFRILHSALLNSEFFVLFPFRIPHSTFRILAACLTQKMSRASESR
jgi:hypothetical protein